jgi:hypothetical protein
MRASTFAASDFKTLYASIWCFTHRMNAYSFTALQKVYVANGVVQPEKWYGHAPVYPWTTLALLSPLSAIPMVPAAYVLIVLSAALLGGAVAELMRYAANNLPMSLPWRMAIAALCACGPLVGFGMDLGNVSVAASALCVLAFVRRNSEPPWIAARWRWMPSIALAAALILKPHLALWAAIAMLLLPERATRNMVLRSLALVAGFSALVAAALAAVGMLGMETHAYLAMLTTETSGASSMSATSREVLPVVSQITSIASMIGFWIANSEVRAVLTGLALLVLGFLAIRQTRKVDSERGALLAVGMWSTLGLLATYHRAHDAVLLLLLVPWGLDRVRRAPLAWHAWTAALLYTAMSISVDLPIIVGWVANAPANSLLAFVLLRQVGLATILLFLVLLFAMEDEHKGSRINVQSTSAEVLQAAA